MGVWAFGSVECGVWAFGSSEVRVWCIGPGIEVDAVDGRDLVQHCAHLRQLPLQLASAHSSFRISIQLVCSGWDTSVESSYGQGRIRAAAWDTRVRAVCQVQDTEAEGIKRCEVRREEERREGRFEW
eukprot:256050-Rhodomonas_salina.1